MSISGTGKPARAIFDAGAPPPCPAPFNMAAHVLDSGAARDDKTALEILGGAPEAWSYGALRRAVRGIGTGLLRRGLAPGDLLLLRLGNTVDFPLAYLGAIAAGIVPLATSSQLTEPELDAMLEGLEPAGMVCAPGLALPGRALPAIGLDELAAMRGLPCCDYHMGAPDRIGYVVFTSGTSGRARAVAHAHRAIWARGMMMEGWYGLRPDDRLLHAGAFNWTFTLGTGLMDPWTRGATALIAGAGTAPSALPALLAGSGATILAAAPGVFRKMLDASAPPALPRLRHALSAGEKLPDALRARFREATGCEIYEAYGMSECSTFISCAPGGPAPSGTDSLGWPQPGRRVAVLGAEGPAGRGEEGVIAVSRRDPGLMLGYLGAEDEAAARMRGEWFLTGDRGVMEADGQIRYLGRDDDMMNAGGFRVSPLEVEAALLAHPLVVEAAACEVEVREGVRVIALFYVAAREIDDAELAEHAAARLARYKQPRLFRRLDALPRNANGKILRRALRDGAG